MFYIWEAAVTDFCGVPVEDFAQFVVLGEVLVDQGEEDFGEDGKCLTKCVVYKATLTETDTKIEIDRERERERDRDRVIERGGSCSKINVIFNRRFFFITLS